jgi:hypothetical protein
MGDENSLSHHAKAGKTNWLGEMQYIAEFKTFFIRINLGLSEAATQNLDVGARRARVKARPEPA